jgi:hypothetical protein
MISAPWRGEEQLWVVWLYNWTFGTLFRMASPPLLESQSTAIVATVLALGLALSVYIGVSLWRCAFNVGWRPAGYIVRALVIAMPLLLVASEAGWVS